MTTSFGRQLRAMIRKNYILKKRKKCATVGEFLTPFLFCLVLMLLTGNNIVDILTDPDGRSK
jgi:hypothetical protein